MKKKVFEICAGAGGQALGLERAGFEPAALVEVEPICCETLRLNRPAWNVIQGDVRAIDGKEFEGVDLFAGGVPCPPFSIASKQLGQKDERDLFPQALRLIRRMQPTAVMLENVRGLATAKFSDYLDKLEEKLRRCGYESTHAVLNASDYGVPQLRPRFILVAFRDGLLDKFSWPAETDDPPTVADAIGDLMAEGGWKGVDKWRKKADSIAPTIVGGSKKHGGPDLGPTRSKRQWATLGVDGMGIADAPPDRKFPVNGLPRMTVRMAARIQGFPDEWKIAGRKTASYRQIGNAFPPPVATAVGKAILSVLKKGTTRRKSKQKKKDLVSA